MPQAFVELDKEYISLNFRYDPDTGVVQRIRENGELVVCNTRVAEGYISSTVDGQPYLMHRVAWLIHYGVPPDGVIDHINRDKTDNRICNLRVVTLSENQQKTDKKATNTSGHKGVFYEKRVKKWRVQICANGKRLNIGYFADLEDAANAYANAAAKHHSVNPHAA